MDTIQATAMGNNNVSKLKNLYFESMLSELASPRYPSSKKVHDTIEIGT